MEASLTDLHGVKRPESFATESRRGSRGLFDEEGGGVTTDIPVHPKKGENMLIPQNLPAGFAWQAYGLCTSHVVHLHPQKKVALSSEVKGGQLTDEKIKHRLSVMRFALHRLNKLFSIICK